MGVALFANNAASTLASGITNAATSLTVASGQGARFPSPTGSDYFYATLTQAGATETSWEIVKVTARSTDTLTIVRAQDGTSAAAWSTGSKVELRWTKASVPQADGTTLSNASQSWSVNYGTSGTTACAGNDSRLSDSRTPTGSAGGDLTGTYPNPTVGANKVTNAQLAQAAADTLKGNNTGSTANVADLTVSQVMTLLGVTGPSSLLPAYYPDITPTTPNSRNDEFNGALSGNWTQIQLANLAAQDSNTTVPGAWYVQPNTSGNISCIVQALPNGNFTIYAAISTFFVASSSVQVGIVLADGNTAGAGNQFIASINTAGATLGCSAGKTTNYGAAWGTTILTNSNIYGTLGQSIYLRLRWDGTNYSFAISNDGYKWFRRLTWTSATLGFTPTYMGLGVGNTAAASIVHPASFGFFRYYGDATSGITA